MVMVWGVVMVMLVGVGAALLLRCHRDQARPTANARMVESTLRADRWVGMVFMDVI